MTRNSKSNIRERTYANMKMFREIKGLTQKQMAKLVGVSRGLYAAWENKHSFPSSDQLIKLADAFGLTIDQLCGRTRVPIVAGQYIF